jgi:SulP family sulfate permease
LPAPSNKTLLTRVLPFLEWFRGLTLHIVRADAIAGLTVALVLIPQSMAYAQLAGLPPYYGLYAAFLPPMVAALFGSSRQLATGPVAVVSLMTAATLEPLATAGSHQYIAYALLLALLVGLFQLALGVLRLGLIVNFISHPVVNGFTNAAALIIASSQLSKVFRVHVDKAEHHYETVYRVMVAALDHTHLPTLGMAALAFVVMYGLRRLDRRIPNVLVAVVVTTVLSWVLTFENDVRAGIEQIHSETATRRVRAFNAGIAEKSAFEQLRGRGVKNLVPGPELTQMATERCVRCHAAPVSGPLPLPGLDDDHQVLVNVRMLLRTEGLLGKHFETVSRDIENDRADLRLHRFEAVSGPAGQLDFYPAGRVPEGLNGDEALWHLSVGNEALDQEALKLVGGGAVVGTVPEGLPSVRVPSLDWSVMGRLFMMAMIISLLGFVEAISIAKAMAARTQQRLDPNQELIGQGLGNILGCMMQSYPVSGSFSRSAVNLQAGAITGLSNVVCCAVVALVLLFVTPLLYHLPQPVLAAIIMMAVIGLLNVRGFIHAWKAQRFDGLVVLITFVATLYFAPHLEWGIALGVGLSLARYLHATMRPPVADLSLHRDGALRDANRHHLRRCRHIAAIRFDGPLNFANTSYLEDKVMERVVDLPQLRHVLLAAHGINEIDASGEELLGKLVVQLRKSGYDVSFSGLKDNVLDVLERTGLAETIGKDHMYPTQQVALDAIHAKAHENSLEEICPLVTVVPKDPTELEGARGLRSLLPPALRSSPLVSRPDSDPPATNGDSEGEG